MFRSTFAALLTTVALAGAASAQDAALHDLLPQEIKDAGTLRVLAATTGAPMVYLGEDARTLEGLEIDLTNALGAALGVKIEYTTGTFDSLIPSITADRADLGVGSIGDLKARQEQVDFVDYVKAGIAMAVLPGNPKKISDLDSLCGNRIAVLRGTFQEDELNGQKAKCEAAGSSLEIQTFGDTNAAVMALRTDRVDAWSGDSAPVGYAVAQSKGAIELAPGVRAIAVLGYAVGKDNKPLAEAMRAGLQALIDNGTYSEIFAKWGQSETALDKITINDAWL